MLVFDQFFLHIFQFFLIFFLSHSAHFFLNSIRCAFMRTVVYISKIPLPMCLYVIACEVILYTELLHYTVYAIINQL